MTTYKSLISGYIGSGTFAARPVAATIAADLPPGTASSYFATDTGVLYQVGFGQTVWTAITAAGPALLGAPWTVPLLSQFTTFNLGTASLTDNSYGIGIDSPNQAIALRGAYKASPAIPFTIYARIEPTWLGFANNQRWGILLRNSTSGRHSHLGFINNSSGQIAFDYQSDWSNTFVFANSVGGANILTPIAARWLKVDVTSTTATLYMGDGYRWNSVSRVQTLSTYLNVGGGNVDGIGFCWADGSNQLWSLNSFSTAAPAAGGGGQL
jgi:hypothetical protein